jgi:uncharacterized protein (UPF0305 family)
MDVLDFSSRSLQDARFVSDQDFIHRFEQLSDRVRDVSKSPEGKETRNRMVDFLDELDELMENMRNDKLSMRFRNDLKGLMDALFLDK